MKNGRNENKKLFYLKAFFLSFSSLMFVFFFLRSSFLTGRQASWRRHPVMQGFKIDLRVKRSISQPRGYFFHRSVSLNSSIISPFVFNPGWQAGHSLARRRERKTEYAIFEYS